MTALLRIWLELVGAGLVDEIATAIAAAFRDVFELPGLMLDVLAYVLGG